MSSNNWTITEVQNLTGNRFNQTGSPQGAYLTIVTTDATITGDGTVLNPLVVATPLVYETSTANIKMDGSVSVGVLTTVARADHIHASDTSREPTITTKNTAFNKNYGTTATDVKINGTQAVGSVDEIARIDHVHPTDTSRASLTGTETLTNKTLTLPKINEDVQVTATATELNVLDGIPATLTATELGYVDGVTSSIQTQLNTLSSSSFGDTEKFILIRNGRWL